MAGWAARADSSSRLSAMAVSRPATPLSSASTQGTAATPTTSRRDEVGPHKLCAFDYHYTTGSGKNDKQHHFSGVIITTNLPLKPLWIRHETFSTGSPGWSV